MEKYINYTKLPPSNKMKAGGCACGCAAQTISNHTDPFKQKIKIVKKIKGKGRRLEKSPLSKK